MKQKRNPVVHCTRLVLALAKRLHQTGLDGYCESAKRAKDTAWTWEDLDKHQRAGWKAVATFMLSQNH